MEKRIQILKINTLQKMKKNVQNNYEFCKNIIEMEYPIKIEKIRCLFLIIHRFINNLFHGNKKPHTLNLFKNEFQCINKFLIYFIEKTSHEDSINKKRFISTN